MSDRRRAYVLNDAQVRETVAALRSTARARTSNKERVYLESIALLLAGQCERQKAADEALTKSNKKRG